MGRKGNRKKASSSALTAAPRGPPRGPNLQSIASLKNEGMLADLEFESTWSLAKTFGPYLVLQDIAQHFKQSLVKKALEARPNMGPREREELYRDMYKDDAPLWETIVFASRSDHASSNQDELPFGEATVDAYREAATRGEWTEARVSTNGAVQWRSHRVRRDEKDEYFGYGVRFASVKACMDNDENEATAVFVTGRLAVVDWHLSRIVEKLLFTQKLADDRLGLLDLADVQEQIEKLKDLLKQSQPVLERNVPTRRIFDATETELRHIMRRILTTPLCAGLAATPRDFGGLSLAGDFGTS